MKDDIRAMAMAVTLIVAGLFFWHVAHLSDCRDAARTNTAAGDSTFEKLSCPQTGPYGPSSSVLLFAVFSPLFPSAIAGPQDKIAGREK